MANNLYVNDAHTLMNAIAKQVLGADAPQAIDTTSFVTVAETTLRAGVETTLSAISQVLGETIFSIRPYSYLRHNDAIAPSFHSPTSYLRHASLSHVAFWNY